MRRIRMLLPDISGEAYLKKFMVFLDVHRRESPEISLLQGLKEWVFAASDAGHSMAGAFKTFQVMEAIGYSSGMSEAERGQMEDIKQIIKKLHRKWEPLRRFPLSENQVMMIAFNPPVEWSEAMQQIWTVAIILAWVFLLRGMEIKDVRPQDVTILEGGLMLKVVRPKIGKDAQHCTIPLNHIHPKMLEVVLQFASLGTDEYLFRRLPKNFATHIRSCLGAPQSRKDIVFHSIRHGRAFELHHKVGVTIQDLQVMGRWRRVSSVMVYIHH